MKAKNKLSKEEESTINNILDSIRKTDKKVYIGDADSDLLKNIIIEDVYEVGISQSESADVEYRLVINDIKSDNKTLFMSDILSKDLIKKYNGMYKELCSKENKRNDLCSKENKNSDLEEFFSYMNSENDIDEYKEYFKELIGNVDDLEKITSSEYPESIFWRKDGEVILEYTEEKEVFLVKYDTIWIKLRKKYGLSDYEISSLLRSLLEEAFELKVTTTLAYSSFNWVSWTKLSKKSEKINMEETNNSNSFDNTTWYAENGTVYNTDDDLATIVCFYNRDIDSYMNLPHNVAERVAQMLNNK